ncbi:hypothetical protein OPIT5_10365 [Opitutaceae bacterium TAV5]|nr:hypothetical protein OPIT5_10365 [Opitutaceae bacterium TAV5]
MKTTCLKTGRLFLLSAIFGFPVILSMAQAATWYWIGPADNSPTNTAYWNSTPTSGTGQTMSAAGAVFSAGDIYDTNNGNNMLINGNFPTGLLLLNGNRIAIRGTRTVTITNLEAAAATTGILAYDGYNQSASVVSKFVVTNLNLAGDIRFHNQGGSGTQSGARNMTYQITNVSGSGKFRLTGGLSGGERSTILLSIVDQELTNDFTVEGVNVTFQSDITTTGTLTLIGTDLSLNLDTHSLVFSSITDGTQTWTTQGAATAAVLNAFFGAEYFTGTGMITIAAVPEPFACALAVGILAASFACLRRRLA